MYIYIYVQLDIYIYTQNADISKYEHWGFLISTLREIPRLACAEAAAAVGQCWEIALEQLRLGSECLLLGGIILRMYIY
jgi:hypothetical protein